MGLNSIKDLEAPLGILASGRNEAYGGVRLHRREAGHHALQRPDVEEPPKYDRGAEARDGDGANRGEPLHASDDRFAAGEESLIERDVARCARGWHCPEASQFGTLPDARDDALLVPTIGLWFRRYVKPCCMPYMEW